MGVASLLLRPRRLEGEAELEQVLGEVVLALHRDAEPLDRATGLDQGAALLPERAGGSGQRSWSPIASRSVHCLGDTREVMP